MSLAVMALLSAVFAVLLWQGVALVEDHGSTTLPTSGVPIAWKYAAVPVGAALMLIRTIQVYGSQVYRLWKTGKKIEPALSETVEGS
jgi:TRAP-type C4-dicarboxylate transport system permease small subunit